MSKPECSDAEVCTDANVEVKRLRRELRRYRAWLRLWRRENVVQFTEDDGFIQDIDAALAGKPAPRKGRG